MASPALQNSASSSSILGMGSCYALGTFTDNFYKQAAILLAAAMHMQEMQSYATVLFSLPFVIFSAWAGWLADKVVKKHIVIAAKIVELLALLVGAVMLVNGLWTGILIVVACMGLQATIFSPAINGSIPEQFPVAQVPRVNSLIKLASTAAVLAGISMAGIFLDVRQESLGGVLPTLGMEDGAAYGRAIAGVFIIIVAVLGVVTAFTIRKYPAASAKSGKSLPFPWTGPLDSVRHMIHMRKDKQLFLVLLAEAYFYGIAAIAVISIANLAKSLSYSDTLASLLSAVLMIGIACGSLIAGKKTAESWRRVLFPSALLLGFFLILVSLTPYFPATWALPASPQLVWLFTTLFLCGICGGMYLIPVASFIQVRPAANEKGKTLGTSNFMTFSSIALFGAMFRGISQLPAAVTFFLYGAVTIAFAVFVASRIRTLEGSSMKDGALSLLGMFLRALLSLRYSVTETGLESIPAFTARPAQSPDLSQGQSQEPHEKTANKAAGILFLPNHPALIDPILVFSRIAGLRPRPLADENQMRGVIQSAAGKIIRAVIIPDLRKNGRSAAHGVKKAMTNITEALQKGDNVLLYPSGRLYRSSKEDLGANSAVAQILEQAPEARVVLVRTTGLWGSSFSYAEVKKGQPYPRIVDRLLRGLTTLLSNALFFTPRRKITMEFVEPADLPRTGDKFALNRYLEAFYNKAETPAQSVPRFFWQGSKPVPLALEAAEDQTVTLSAIPQKVQDTVYAILRETVGLADDHVITPEMTLNSDLGLDSLSLMDVATALEAEYGYPLPNLEALVTVESCLQAAVGKLESEDGTDHRAVPDAWFFMGTSPLGTERIYQPEGASTVLHAFLHHARKAPAQPLLADRTGVRTRREVLTGVLALAPLLRELPGTRLGIMLPATPAATTIWLAALLAGKEPVMLNWTVGPQNMRHCITLSGITHAVTSSQLLDKLADQGTPLDTLPITWVAAEDLGSKLSLFAKVRAASRAWLHCAGLTVAANHVPETAAVLFTSGSEAAPKAVPLTHTNVLTNARDVVSMLNVQQRDRVLAMLPPFHSFGLMVGLVLPASCGIAAAYHPNPTESAPLVFLVRDYKLTLLGATPTFLDAMLQRVRGTTDMETVRYAFVGAEKCPARVYKAFAECCPEASLCEGYGITECSPVVSVNVPENVKPGTIGFFLPSVHAAIVKEEETPDGMVRVRVASGQTGMLLVRGASIFSGYIGESPDPFVEFEGERWYRTGDLVLQEQGGHVSFQGRLKRFVKLGGEMISLPQMEAALLTALAGRADLPEDGKPFAAIEAKAGSEEAGHAEILAFTTLDISLQEVNQAFRQAGLASLYSVRRVVKVAEIPLLGSGKTDYRALQKFV